jgi:transposase
METIVRRSVGIDIAKATFTACICTHYSTCQNQMSEVVQFENGKRGFNQLLKWEKTKFPSPEPVFLMEATGIYYEPLAYHLHKLSAPVAVVLPNKVKHYAKSRNVKSKTDVIDARLTSPNGGAERSLELWQPPAPIFKNLRAITRLYRDLKDQRTAFENRLHSTKAGEEPLAFILQSTKSIITKLDREIEKCAKQIKGVIHSEKWLEEKIKKIVTTGGVGVITAAIVVAETQRASN